MVPLDKGLQWANVKQKPFRQVHPGIIQAYSGIFRTLCNPDIFRTVVLSRTLTYSKVEAYLELWHIDNRGIFITPIYSERWHIQNMRHIQNPVKHLR